MNQVNNIGDTSNEFYDYRIERVNFQLSLSSLNALKVRSKLRSTQGLRAFIRYSALVRTFSSWYAIFRYAPLALPFRLLVFTFASFVSQMSYQEPTLQPTSRSSLHAPCSALQAPARIPCSPSSFKLYQRTAFALPFKGWTAVSLSALCHGLCVSAALRKHRPRHRA
jgi:hypothetical protein